MSPVVFSGVCGPAAELLPRPDRFGEKIHQPGVECHLLRRVGVRLVGGRCLAAIEAEWIDRTFTVGRIRCVRVAGEKSRGQAVHHRRVRRGDKLRLTGWIRRMGICAEVVIERNILREDYYYVLDWCNRRRGGCRHLQEQKCGETG